MNNLVFRRWLSGVLLLLPLGGLVAETGDIGTILFSVQEEATGRILPARVYLKNEVAVSKGGRWVFPDEDKVVRVDKYPFHIDHFNCPGTVELELPPGNYTYEVFHGQQYSKASGCFSVEKDQEIKRTIPLRRLADITQEGWWSGDIHIHRDPRPQTMELLMQSEDIHVAPVITWWSSHGNPWAHRPVPENPTTCFDGNRFCNIMVGEDERYGGALLFFNLKEPIRIGGAREYPSSIVYLNEAKKFGGVHVDAEKPFWWDLPLWLACGSIDSVGIANNQMWRTGMFRGEGLGRPRDSERYPRPYGQGFYCQDIYYHILNTGHRVAPSAGSASGVLPNPLGYNRVWVHVGPTLTYDAWWKGLREGRSFVSNGPLLRCRANGEWPGHVFQADPGKRLEIDVIADLFSRGKIGRIEVIKNGDIVNTILPDQWENGASLCKVEFRKSGWFLVRVFVDHPQTFRFASTAPWYVEVAEQKNHISMESVQYFLDWEQERISRLEKWRLFKTPEEKDEVLKQHLQARAYWEDLLQKANAE